MPISTPPVQNEDCNNATRGGEAEDIRHEGKIYQAWHLTGVPTECTSPPIRDGVPHTPKLIPHEPPLPTGTSSSFSLTTKNGDRKATQEHFDNKPSKSSFGLRAPNFIFSNGRIPPNLTQHKNQVKSMTRGTWARDSRAQIFCVWCCF